MVIIVDGLSASGYLIVKCKQARKFKIGTMAIVGNKNVGKVVDVIGPVNSPWILVKLFPDWKEKSHSLVGKKIIIKG